MSNKTLTQRNPDPEFGIEMASVSGFYLQPNIRYLATTWYLTISDTEIPLFISHPRGLTNLHLRILLRASACRAFIIK